MSYNFLLKKVNNTKHSYVCNLIDTQLTEIQHNYGNSISSTILRMKLLYYTHDCF